jgi:predicted O-linked N-acetylglucosamine transferase (SPINDLY family)
MRIRVTAAMDRFLDVRLLSDPEVARLSRELEVDIAVDLKGFTQHARTGIFARRAAPIQVNYLGFPGTMGADYIDYLIADPTLIPQASRRHYSEKIVYLPDSYQVNDSTRLISTRHYTRAEEGLPEHGFVYCCFNYNYKIVPAIFDIWMRLLAQVEGSVLWLLESNSWATGNLREEALLRGISPERLIFAQRLPLAEHLARHSLADLFLDTFPCNAHTTASDALWAGVPVLTRTGATFASRVAASLLGAIDLPELVTTTAKTYEALAAELAFDAGRRGQIRERLQRNRLNTPLFDAPSFTRHLEAAYSAMYERHQADLLPEHIHIAGQSRADRT